MLKIGRNSAEEDREQGLGERRHRDPRHHDQKLGICSHEMGRLTRETAGQWAVELS